MSVLRDHYFKLGSDLPKERLSAATQLISELIKVNDSKEWEYALNRLIKGIITTRQSAKFGFSMALTEVVNELIERKELTVGKYLDLLVETTKITSSMKGKEQRAVLFGRLFGLQVLINSKIILQSSEDDVVKFVETLLELSNVKNWIRETGFFTLIQFIKLVQDDDSIDYKKKIYIKILSTVNDLGLNLSTEGLAVYLSIPNSDKLSQKISNLKANWKNGDPFHKGNLPVLAKVLKDVEVINDEENEDNNKKQKSSWNSRLPFVWDLIVLKFNQLESSPNEDDDIDAVPTSETSKKRKKKDSSKKSSKKAKTEQEYISIKEFWKVVIDETLFSEKSSYERKYWGFEIFEKFVTSLINLQLVQYLFTPNFMRCLINQHASSSRMLYKISQQTIKSLVKIIKEKQNLAPIVLLCLLDESKGGCWNFDLISKSRTIDEILQVKSQINLFISILLNNFESKLESQNVVEDSDKNSNDNILKWYLDKIVNLIKHNKQVQLSDSIIESILTKMIKYAFFQSKEINISKFLQSVAKERLSSLLSELITTRLSNENNFTTWSTFCFQTIKELSQTEKCLVEFDEDLALVEQETSDLLKTIIELNKSSDKLYIFELLFSMCLIQLYMEDEETVQVINEIKLVFENQFTSKIQGQDEDEDDDQVDDSVVLTEIVLSFISRKSTLFKKLSSLVWENFLCKSNETDGKLRVNDACFRLLFDVLEAKENKQGQQKLFEGEGGDIEGEDDEEEEEEDDEDGDGEDDDEEEDEETEEKDQDNDEDNDSDSDSENDSDLDDVNDTMTELDKQTNLKLAQALGIPTKETGEVKFDELDDLSSNEEYESDSMDDEQMMAMDDELSRIFKHRQDTLNSLPTGNKRKLEVLEAKENMIFFKNRILDLLEIFIKVNPSLQFNLTFITPLITLMNLTLDKNLGVKAHKLLKNKVSKTKIDLNDLTKYYPQPNEYYETLVQLISELQDKANTVKSSNQAVNQSYNQSCIIVAKNLIALDENNMEKVVEIYCDSLKKWCLSNDSKLQSSLFFDFINWINTKKNNTNNNKK